ncbi:oligosaccharide flippase family protein [Providencia manganoxydans]|uniref:oligosaccharide flippase family protein n=1 Tax=Providencia manganoxydans TaxID=2923283 RepID=UPI0034E54530
MNIRKLIEFSIGPLGAAFVGFITLPILTWCYSSEDIGRISLLVTIISFSTLVFSLGLDQFYVREYHETDNKNKLIKDSTLPGLFLLIISYLLLFLYDNKFISRLLFNIESSTYSFIIILCIIFSFSTRFLSLPLRMEEKGIYFSLIQLAPKLVILITLSSILLLKIKYNFFSLLMINFTSYLATFIIAYYLTQKSINWFSKWDICFIQLKKGLRFGAPLILGGAAFWGLTSLDRLLLKELSNLEELAIYSVSINFAGAAIILQSVFSTIWAPMVYKWISEKSKTKEKITKINESRNLILDIIIIFFCLSGLFSFLIDYIIPSEYSNVKYIFVSCMNYPLLYVISETTVIGLAITRKTEYSMYASFISLIVNIVSNFLLIPLYGAAGSAISSSLSFLIFFILRTEFSIYFWVPIDRFKLYTSMFILVGMSILYTLTKNQHAVILNIIWFITLTFYLFKYRKKITISKNNFKK